MAVPLSEQARRLLDQRVFVVLSTTNPDGSPQSSVVWVKRDGDEILFSTIRGRRKTRNMERDPRVSMCGYDPADPYRYFEARGTVRMTEEGGDALIAELSLAYTGQPWREAKPDAVRVVCRLAPDRLIDR
jgi:PPOX class probable F420-dependent enzyme